MPTSVVRMAPLSMTKVPARHHRRVRRRLSIMNCSARAVLMFLAIWVGACAPRSDQASLRTANDQETAAITKIFTDFATAWNAGDADRIGSFYADDAIILPGNHQAESGRDAIVKFNKDFFEH